MRLDRDYRYHHAEHCGLTNALHIRANQRSHRTRHSPLPLHILRAHGVELQEPRPSQDLCRVRPASEVANVSGNGSERSQGRGTIRYESRRDGFNRCARCADCCLQRLSAFLAQAFTLQSMRLFPGDQNVASEGTLSDWEVVAIQVRCFCECRTSAKRESATTHLEGKMETKPQPNTECRCLMVRV